MRLLILFSILFLLSACMSHYESQGEGSKESLFIAENVRFKLLSTIPFENGLTLTQGATVNFQDENHDLIFHTEINHKTLTMVGLTPTGTRLFTIVTEEGNIRADGFSSIVDNIKPEFLLADMQLSLWPMTQLNNSIQGAILTEPSATARQLNKGNQTIITIHYSQAKRYKGTIEFTHHERGYKLNLTPIAVEYSSHE